MLKRTKTLGRWILGLVVFEAILAVSLWLMPDATTEPRFLFLLFVAAVNLPGVVVASGLGLFGHDAWGRDGHPMPGWAVVFGVSLLFYLGCIWMAQSRAGTKNKSS